MTFFFREKYLRVHPDDVDDGDNDDKSYNISQRGFNHQYTIRSPFSTGTLWIPWILVLCLLVFNLYTWRKIWAHNINGAVYSPVAHLIRYKNIRFTAGIKPDFSPYQGPPHEENDRLWEELYQFGTSELPTDQAARLTNGTTPIPAHPGFYGITLTVFHDIHCLNMIRKRIYWNTSMPIPPEDPMNMVHIEHCINALRQSLLCASDITPIPFKWYTMYNTQAPATGILHTCRDFSAIKQWAVSHQAVGLDLSVPIYDDPLGSDDYIPPPLSNDVLGNLDM